ncbi:MAG: hypothetical protein QXS68_05235 [Candidatus Methanomethylicaceae archaeon]
MLLLDAHVALMLLFALPVLPPWFFPFLRAGLVMAVPPLPAVPCRLLRPLQGLVLALASLFLLTPPALLVLFPLPLQPVVFVVLVLAPGLLLPMRPVWVYRWSFFCVAPPLLFLCGLADHGLWLVLVAGLPGGGGSLVSCFEFLLLGSLAVVPENEKTAAKEK